MSSYTSNIFGDGVSVANMASYAILFDSWQHDHDNMIIGTNHIVW
jgi:hypothetical protein